MLGYVPAPELEYGGHLIAIFRQIGPVKGDGPISEMDLESWERRRGVDLKPWQAELLVNMSKMYLGEMHSASSASAISPWPKARNMWKYVCDNRNVKKDKAPDGDRQRRRNPTPG